MNLEAKLSNLRFTKFFIPYLVSLCFTFFGCNDDDSSSSNPVESGSSNTIYFQPGRNGIEDARVEENTGNSNHANTNYGNEADFWIEKYSYNEGHKLSRFFIKFNSLPYDLDVIYVGIGLFGFNSTYDVQSSIIDVQRVSQPWGENSITWNNQPSFSGGVCDSKTPPTDQFLVNYCDITNLAKDWKRGTYPNYGVVFRHHRDEELTNGHYGGKTSESLNDITPILMIIKKN